MINLRLNFKKLRKHSNFGRQFFQVFRIAIEMNLKLVKNGQKVNMAGDTSRKIDTDQRKKRLIDHGI